jgi:hypothetical protein
MGRLELYTSPGLPYTDEHLKRIDLLDATDPEKWVPTERLNADIEQLEAFYHAGTVGKVVGYDFPKDELLKPAKIAAGKTRHITSSSLAFCVLVRRVFGSFEERMKTASIHSGSAVGIAPESTDWQEMINYMRRYGSKGWCGDYTNFDGTIPAEVIQIVVGIMSSFYAEPDSALIAGFCEDIIHTTARCGTLVYSKHLGNPSGCPITTTLNTLSNLVLLAYGLLEAGAPPDAYRLSAIIAYGDDCMIVPGLEMRNACVGLVDIARVLRDFGITLRNEVGEGMKSVPINDFVFLKRKTRYAPDLGVHVPVLNRESINDMTNWTRATNEIADVSKAASRVMAVQLAIFFYGRTEFDEVTRRLQKACIKSNLQVQDVHRFFNYDELAAMFHSRDLSKKFEDIVFD